jgi:AAA15 family ATPase/GTPase
LRVRSSYSKYPKKEIEVFVEDVRVSSLTAIADKMGWKEEPTKFVLFTPNDTSTLNDLKDRIRKMWDLIVKLEANTSVVKHINECIDETYTEIFEEGTSVRKEAKSPYYIKLEDLGDGIEKAIKVMLFFEAIKPKLVLWDDFEASAHPSLIKILLKWLSEKDWQVVLSTHSIDVLYKLLEVKPEDLKVLQLRRTPEDTLLHKSLSLEELENLIEGNLDPRLLVDALSL